MARNNNLARRAGWPSGLRLAALAALSLAGSVLMGGAANAQVQATFYANYPAAPDPLGAYLGGAVLCSASAFGTASGGFSLNFNDAATRSALCPANPDLLSPFLNNQLGARFVGSLVVATAGDYNLTLNADDGDALAINGVLVRSDWFAKPNGPGSFTVALNAGGNPFVLDYFQGPCCNAFVELLPGAGVDVIPVVPEPATFALTALGLAALAFRLRGSRG